MKPRIQRSGVGTEWGARISVAFAFALFVVPQAAQAQPRPSRPDAVSLYAIQGARIVTVSGQTIENGTVVVENGVIQAVGRNVSIPRGAWVIDGSGKTVYPGFIDALTTLGHESAPVAQGFGFGGGGGGPVDISNHSWGPEDRPGTSTWVSAAEDITAGDGRFNDWRNHGFTSVLTTMDVGLVTGQAAVINLGSYVRPRELVVRTPVAMGLKLQDRSYTGYPNSLMGSFAYLKQLYYDGMHYGAVWDDYDADPSGKVRPEWDIALEPIRQQLAEGWPALFPAEGRKEVVRAIATSAEMGVTPIVHGLQGGYEAADLLAAAGVSAIVDLDWPSAPRDGDPEAVPSLDQLRLWDRAPTTPGVLASAGVRFAFSSGGSSDASGILDGARHAIAQGLSEADAIRAFTLSPAEMFGVDDRLGSVEVGKIANLLVTSGSIFSEGTRIESVFVDGEKFDVPERVADASPAGRDARGGPGGPGGRAGGGGRGAGSDEGPSVDRSAAPVAMSQDRGAYRSDDVTFITGATIMTASNGTILNGDIVIRDGRIAEIGSGLRRPGGARVVDAAGKFVTPGIIDAHSHMAAEAINEGAVNVSSMVTIEDVIDPTDRGMYFALGGGVTTVNILHGSANPIGGGNAVIKLLWGADADELLIGATPGIKFALGENTKRDREPDRYPATRMGVQDVVRQAFLDATYYMEGWDAWEAGGRQGVAPRRDLEMESLMQILKGERWVHSHSYRADEILQLLRLAEEFGFTVRTFQHVLEGYKVADEIAAHGAGASTFSDWWAYKVEAYDAIPYNAALMAERGVLVSINSDSGEEVRHLNQEAAKAMKWGDMEEEAALRLVTLNPAIQLGIDDQTGSLEVGKDADIAIWDAHPLSMFSKAVQTYVDGQLYFDIELDEARQEALEAERAALIEKHGVGQAGGRGATDRIASPGQPNGEVNR
ncbi:MAG: amidohydrolase family protein [Gemmatimonadetes bacterium]|nr:amidohydrolase family protein [Gemmatimonadota bacterium]MDA1103702.1 amidohydrolase family protein [Gemmatimonadota bacterium]